LSVVRQPDGRSESPSETAAAAHTAQRSTPRTARERLSDRGSIDLTPVCDRAIQPVGRQAMRGRLLTIRWFGSTGGWHSSPRRVRVSHSPLSPSSSALRRWTVGRNTEAWAAAIPQRTATRPPPRRVAATCRHLARPGRAIFDELGRPQRCLRLTVRTAWGAERAQL